MPGSTHVLTLPVPMFERGFWLYVWRISSVAGDFLYVGMTGDSSSPNAADPFSRMCQHLSNNKNQNAVRKHLETHCVSPEECTSIELIAHGPIFPEACSMDEHRKPRDTVAALEQKLADTLERKCRGYLLLNKVNNKKPLDLELWEEVRSAFAAHFPELGQDL